MAVSFLLLGSLALMVARVWMPWPRRAKGKVLVRIPLALRGRVRLQRTNVYAIGGLLLLGSVGGWLPTGMELFTITVVLALLFLPVSYTLTDAGIVVGHTPIRHWSEFRVVQARQGGLRLVGADDWRDMDLWLTGTALADQLLPRIQAFVGPRERRRSRNNTRR